MSNLRSTIEGLASQFASSVLEALRSASIDELAGVTGAGGLSGVRRGRPRATGSDDNASGGLPRRRGAGRGGRLGRRTAGDITKMIEAIVDLLTKSGAGMRAEQIREALGVEAKELPRPLAEAISGGRITKSGQKRATTYFAGGGGSSTGGKRRGRRPGAKSKKR